MNSISNLTSKEIDKLSVALDKLEGRLVNIDYVDNILNPLFHYEDFQGYEQDGLLYIGDINYASSIDVEMIKDCKIEDTEQYIIVSLGLTNGSKIRIYN